MDTLSQIEARRDDILKQMRAIRSMKRGTINEQYLKVKHKGKTQPVIKGPYYVLSRREGNRTVSERITSMAGLEQAKEDVETHKQFVALCREFEQLTERLGEMERKESGLQVEKKPHRSLSSKTEKS